MKTVPYLSDWFTEMIDPTLHTTGAPVLAAALAEARIFELAADTTLAVDNAATDVLVLNPPFLFSVGDNVRVRLNSFSYFESPVASLDASTLQLTLAAPLPTAADAGIRVAKMLGLVVPLVPFNIDRARKGSDDWGFRGLVRDDHPGLLNGMGIRIERVLEPLADQRLTNNQFRLVSDKA